MDDIPNYTARGVWTFLVAIIMLIVSAISFIMAGHRGQS